jgi:hypothetical protein
MVRQQERQDTRSEQHAGGELDLVRWEFRRAGGLFLAAM